MALYRRPSTTALTRHPHSIGGAMYVMHKVTPSPFTPEVPTAPLAPPQATPSSTVNDSGTKPVGYPTVAEAAAAYRPKKFSGGLDYGRRRTF